MRTEAVGHWVLSPGFDANLYMSGLKRIEQKESNQVDALLHQIAQSSRG